MSDSTVQSHVWGWRPAVMGAVCAYLASCGGGPENPDAAPRMPGDRQVAGARHVPASSPAADETATVIFKYNGPGGPAIHETMDVLLHRTIQQLDTTGVPSTLLECGEYHPTNPPQASYPGWPYSAMTFRVRTIDVPRVLALGGAVRDADTWFILFPNACGNRDGATSLSTRVFWYASAAYPDLFPGTPWWRGTAEGYEYAYFASTGNYVGVKDGRVVVHNGRDWTFWDVGAIADYIPTSATLEATANR